MKKEPLISIIIPVYNAENRLQIAIDSILNQTYKNIELILVNDGSYDSSLQICTYNATKDNRVKLINQDNSGVSGARNRGLHEASGDYIMFVDSDDTIDLDAIMNISSYLKNMDIDILLFGMSFDFYNNDRLLRREDYKIKKEIQFSITDIKDYFFELYYMNYLSSVGNKVYRAALIRENKISFNTSMAILEDFKFVLDVLQAVENGVAIKNVFYRYYNDLNNLSLNKSYNIDYMKNFKVLDDTLVKFCCLAKIEDEKAIEQVNSIIFRRYILGLEKEFQKQPNLKMKYSKINNYIMTDRINFLANQKFESSKKIKILKYCIKRKKRMTLFIMFFINQLRLKFKGYSNFIKVAL